VPDEYIERYRNLSHSDLYAMLNAGNPDQVDDLASKWKSLQDTADLLATTLARDLERLGGEWDSESGREFARRVGLIVSYAQMLTSEFGHVKDGLALMSGPLREAKKQAENPADTDDVDKTLKGAATGATIGGAIAGPGGAMVGGVIGGMMGHNQDEEEQEKARQRMIQVVATLAAEYEVTSKQTWPATVPVAPADLPDNGSGGSVDLRGGTGGRTAGGVPLTGPVDPAKLRDTADPTQTTGLPQTGSGTDGTGADLDDRSSLLGAGSLIGAGGVGAGLGIGALTRSSGRTSDAELTGAASAMGGGIVGGVLGGMGDRPERDDRSAASTDQGRRGVSGGRGSGTGDEPDEHTTWLTEDDMVWGGDEESAPAVLGADQLKADEPASGDAPDQPGTRDAAGDG
jgi:hypothetical protein